MADKLVTYDLHRVGQNYDCLYKKLTSYREYKHVQGSVWILRTSKTAKEIRDHLKSCLDENDKLLVVSLSGEAAWHGQGDAFSRWFKQAA